MTALDLSAPYRPESPTDPCRVPLSVGDLTTLLADYDPELLVYVECCKDHDAGHLIGTFGWRYLDGDPDKAVSVFLVPALDRRAYENLSEPG